MSLNVLNELILDHLFGKDQISKVYISNSIKKHSHNLKENGDLSFPLDYEIWKNKILDKSLREDKLEENCVTLVEKSQQWQIPIERIDFKNSRCLLYLNKLKTIQFVFKEVLENNSFGKQELKHNFQVIFPISNNTDLTNWRRNLVATTLNNVLEFCRSNETCSSPNANTVCYLDFSDKKTNYEDRSVAMSCGLVVDASTKKKTNLCFHDYFCSRRRDMQLIAMHKYGIRMQGDTCFAEFLDKLGSATVTIDLLEVKHTSPIQVSNEKMSNSKGASFILYNCARLETLLEKFNDRVAKNFYSELPALSETDLTPLLEEEEWLMVYDFILYFPDMIYRVLENLENGRCALHLIPQFLSKLVSLFSVYYRRVKILVDNRHNLITNLFARIYLLRCVQKIFKISLKFLNIEPIHKM
ncbi:DALR anticodon-binding domain-containing protein 3 [Condylostylus longicornis]|uniref:DALR anticodon-binding domain-containing protein 3 n=1 Tax=Condylostylus longicornis TaxID=2530218 RepID=UPI00244DA3A1|nr:DALR anticodon-binding domain-containing protein 3 [Condylostylus longicornis]